MARSEKGIFVLCLIVYILLVTVFSVIITQLIKLYLKTIDKGVEDKEIITEYESKLSKAKKIHTMRIIADIVNMIIWVCLFSLLFVALYFTFGGNNAVGKIPVLKTVESPSMSKRHEKNTYLKENELEQIDINALIVLRQMPEEKDLKLWDIIMYERNISKEEEDKILILHRIVKIDTDKDGKTIYTLKGDANVGYDDRPVYYRDMKGIYRGESIPELGSFVKFLRSPAGYLCILLVVLVSFTYPFVEKKIEKAKLIRFDLIASAPVEPAAIAVREKPEEKPKKKVPATFRSRFKDSSKANHLNYPVIKNKLCLGKKVTSSFSGRTEKFKYHGELIAMIGFTQKKLKLYLALNPEDYDQTVYRIQNRSDRKRYMKVPLEIQIADVKTLKTAMELIDALFRRFGIELRDKYRDRSLRELLFVLKGNKLLKIKSGSIDLFCDTIRRCDLNLISVKEAKACIETKETEEISDKNFISLSVDILEENYADGQKVTFSDLRKKGLIGPEYNGYIVCKGEKLSKPLFVSANDFETDAVKMIVLTGGRAVRLVPKKETKI